MPSALCVQSEVFQFSNDFGKGGSGLQSTAQLSMSLHGPCENIFVYLPN